METQIELEEKKILELIVETSEEFLQSAGREIDYQKITDNIVNISGARYAVFTIFDDIERKFRTIAVSAPEGILKKVSSLLGYKLQGKTWDYDPVLDARTKSNTITHFSSLQDLSGNKTPRPIITLIEKTFNTGEVILIKILKEDKMIGDFRLIMSKNDRFKNDDYVKLYTRQVGLLITRSRSEARLIESETRLRSVFAAVNDPLFIIDQKTGAILDVNDAACCLYGYTRDEMLKLKDIDMSAEPEKTKKATTESITSIPVRYHKKKDGNVFPVEIAANMFNLDGRKVFAASMRDITERKKSEELLKKERERFANILEGTNVGTWEWNVQTGETIFNERWAEIIGYSLEEISPVNIGIWTRLAHPEDLEKSGEQLNKVFAGEINYYDIECRMRHKEGNWVWVQDRGKVISWTPDGKPLWMSGTHTDITNRKKDQEAVQKSEEKFSTAFHSGSVLMAISTVDKGYYIDVNNAFLKALGFKREEVIGRKSSDLNMFAKIEQREEIKEIFLKEGRVSNAEVFIKGHDRLVRTGIFTADPIDVGGTPCWLTTMTDITDRKHTEVALRESEQKFRDLAQMLPEVVFEMNMQGTLTFVNQRAFKIFGYTQQDFDLGISAVDILIPEDRDKALKVIRMLFQGENSGLNEYTALRTDGSTFPILISSSVVIREGKAVGLRGLIFDITERKAAEIALRNSKEIFSNAFEFAAIGMGLGSPDGRWIKVNPSLCAMLGYSETELLALKFQDITHPDDLDYDLENAGKLLAKEIRIFQTEKRYIHKSGTVVWVFLNTSLVFGEEDKPLYFVSQIQDITARKLSEEILQASEERYRIISEQSPIVIERYSELGVLLDVNPACLELFGVSDIKEIQNFELFSDPNLSDENKKMLKQGQVVRYQGLFDFEIVKELKLYNTTKSGSIWIDVIITPLKNSEGSVNGYLLHVSDITERKKSEEEILHLSFHDHLTGLYNRRFFEEELKRLDTERQLPLSFVMGDLNGLKIVNDVFGHNKGDELLKEVAEIMKSVCRSDDMLARWGGDEFVILLPKTSTADTEEIVQRIKTECGKTSSQKIPASLSLGAATKEIATQDIQAIVIDAESNMYKNKLAQKESLTSSIIFALEQALYEKSSETKEHTDRMHDFALKLGKSVRLSSHHLDELSLLASLHDIGKVAIPETILLKKEKLTEKEWATIKRHPEIGFNIAQSSPQIAHIAKPILSCHENWDGSGYPMGLKGNAIPVISRIILIVDAYDVMTSGRAYKPAMSREEAIEELKRCSGTQFDPSLVERFLEIL